MTEHRGIRWRLIRWATTCRDDASARMADAHTETEDAFQDGRRNAFQAMIDHIESGAPDAVNEAAQRQSPDRGGAP